MINTDFSANRFPRPQNRASVTSSAHLSLQTFETDPGSPGRQTVDSVVGTINTTRELDGATCDYDDLPGQVEVRQNSRFYKPAGRIQELRTLAFDPSTGEAENFSQEYESSFSPDQNDMPSLEVRRSFWRDEAEREHYLESFPLGTTDVIIDRAKGIVTVFSEEF